MIIILETETASSLSPSSRTVRVHVLSKVIKTTVYFVFRLSSLFVCFSRAVFKSEKISTVIHAKDINKFQLAYCNLLKSNMDGLKRQKKQKPMKADKQRNI